MKSTHVMIKSWLVAFAVLLTGCIDVVEPPSIKNIKNVIVINSIISPAMDDINVQVSISAKSFGVLPDLANDSDLITDALVTISSDAREGTLLYDAEQGYYVLSASLFPIEEGVTYRLRVEANQEILSAETTIPSKITTLESINISTDGDGNSVLEMSWEDVAGEENYYRISGGGSIGNNYIEYFDTFYFDNDEFVSDNNRDGQILSAKGMGYSNSYDSITAIIISSNSDYFDYFEILANYFEDDPFSSPVQLPSNIEGGIGLFTAIQISEFTVVNP